jgi:hypothetical protein
VTLRLGVAVLLLLPPAAFAQGNPGPFGGLFGRTPERVGKEYRVFEVRTMATGQYEDAVNDASIPVENRLQPGAIANGGVSGLFAERSSRLSVSARSRATYQQYLQSPHTGGTTVDSSGTVTYEVATRLVLDAAVSHLYSPYFQFHPQFFSWSPDGIPVPPSSPSVATATENHSFSAAGGFTAPYARHSTFSVSATRQETRFKKMPEADLMMSGLHARWSRQVHRDLQFRLGYGRDRGRFGSGLERLHETIDIGLSYVRPLSAERRTSFAVNTETAKLWAPELGRRYRLNGGLNVTRWFRRSWLLGLQFQRSTEFVAGFVEPLLADTVGATLSGMVGRRAELIIEAHGGRGQVGFDAPTERGTMGRATAQVSYALSRRLGLFAQHTLFYNELPQSASPVSSAAYLNRQIITVGLTTWIPIYTRERSPSDTR